MSEFSNSSWSGSCSSEDESQRFDSPESSSSDSSTGQKSSSTSPDTQFDSPKRPSYSFNAIIAMAFQSSPHKRIRLQEIYEYIFSNFPYYNAEKTSGWKSSVRHNLSIHSHFQKVKSEDGTSDYWEMTCDFGTDVFIGEKCGKLHRTGSFCCSHGTQLKESLFFDSLLSSSPDSSKGQKSGSTSPGPYVESSKRPPYSFNSIIAMVIQSNPHKRMRFQDIYDYISTNFLYYKAKKSLGWRNSVRQNLSFHSHFQKVRAEDGQGNYWELTCDDFGKDVYIGEKSRNLLRRGNSKEQPAPSPPVPMDLPNIH